MSPKTLIVDDSLTVRMDLDEAFRHAGLATVLAADAAEMRRVLEREPDVALVILDVVLPDADGIDLLRELRERPQSPHILLLSTEAEVADRIRGLETGADDYVGKPYDAGYVIARARSLLGDTAGPARSTILVVDDSVTFREELKRSLEAADYVVATATSGEEGLKLAAGLRPAAILVDSVMPGIDGATLIRRVRLDAALRGTPCVLLTASEGHGAELRALDAGADAFVRKEDAEVILARLQAVLRSTSADRAQAASLLDPKRILAVDDSNTYLNELSSVLRAEGYEVVAARSGSAALEMLAAQSVDCILLDLVMPDMDGIETCRRIKASPLFRDVPLIMLTAREDRAAMIEGLSTGADDFIAKSNEFEVLTARVRAQLRRKQFEDEHRSIREQLLRSELEATEARAARELAEARARMVEALEAKNLELSSAYQELKQTQSRLVQSAKLASLGELVAGVAHEINNPLAFAISHLQTARTSLAALPKEAPALGDSKHWTKARDRMDEMAGGLDRIRELVLKLRTFSRLDEGERKEVSVQECLDSVLTILGHRLRHRIHVDVQLVAPTMLDCYPSLLNQAIMNLIANAADAIAEEREDGKLTIRGGAEGGSYVLSIADNGCGIPEALRERVFDPFFTTKDIGKGTGLGLSITYSIIKKHGGTLDLLPAPGGGTFAEVRLPLEGPPPEVSSAP
ncbi:MAG: response regulator [Myxococcales bacterium]|nr:MAG: response regulator [Myxococcales bacterium]